MVAIEDRGKYRRRNDVEDDDVDVRVAFDQSEHGYPLPGQRGFFFPSGEP
jgi:hypothetical protein